VFSSLNLHKLFCIAAVACSGCAHIGIQNTTPRHVASNATAIYPITMHVQLHGGVVERNSIKPRVVIDGKARRMRQLENANYGYDYSMASDRNTASYYFDVNYLQHVGGKAKRKNLHTPVYQLTLSNRYAMGLDSNRGTPGMTIRVMGRGFSKKDRVRVGDVYADTRFLSTNDLSFIVPILPADRDYRISIEDEMGAVGAGKLHIDPAIITANPGMLEIPLGGRSTFTLTIPLVAPENGVHLEATTDMPDAISMDEISVFAGRSSCAVIVEALELGNGSLYVTGAGFQELVIPVRVRP
jgi:hypothetical protein